MATAVTTTPLTDGLNNDNGSTPLSDNTAPQSGNAGSTTPAPSSSRTSATYNQKLQQQALEAREMTALENLLRGRDYHRAVRDVASAARRQLRLHERVDKAVAKRVCGGELPGGDAMPEDDDTINWHSPLTLNLNTPKEEDEPATPSQPLGPQPADSPWLKLAMAALLGFNLAGVGLGLGYWLATKPNKPPAAVVDTDTDTISVIEGAGD